MNCLSCARDTTDAEIESVERRAHESLIERLANVNIALEIVVLQRLGEIASKIRGAPLIGVTLPKGVHHIAKAAIGGVGIRVLAGHRRRGSLLRNRKRVNCPDRSYVRLIDWRNRTSSIGVMLDGFRIGKRPRWR